MKKKSFILLLVVLAASALGLRAEDRTGQKIISEIDARIAEIEDDMIQWRRYLHEHPELSNLEFETAKYIAAHLEKLGMEVKTGIAVNGVTGLLVGGKPGPVIALRADMDALPVTEEVDLPFTSKVKTTYHGRETGVMHACGHDAHMAILMATAEVLASVKKDLQGSVKFIFQPAEEGAEDVDTYGSRQMIEEGVLQDPAPEVIFGLHVGPKKVGSISCRSGAMMASQDAFRIDIEGRGTHGSRPWSGTDPIVVGSAIVMNLQSIVSRNVDLTQGAAVISVGSIHGGNRSNIISEEVEMLGTIRTHSSSHKKLIHRRIAEVAENTAAAYGAGVQVEIEPGVPALVNHPEIVEMMLPSLERAAGNRGVSLINPMMGSEDFSHYLNEIPGMFFFLGTGPDDVPPDKVEANHSPRFMVDESGMLNGVKAFCYLVVDYARLKKP